MKIVKILLVVVALGSAAGGLGWWWQRQSIHPSTDDAYLQANVLTIAPQIAGRVVAVGPSEGMRVEAGDLLFQLDDAALRAALDGARAQLDLARQSAGAGGANAAAGQAALDAANAAAMDARANLDRQQTLFDRGDVAQAALDDARSQSDQADARVQQAEAALEAARDQAGGAGPRNAGIRAAEAMVRQAEITLAFAEVTAPVSGWIANLSLRPGDVVSPMQPLFSIVEDGDWWIDANFQETDIERIRPGQPVRVAIDMYSGTEIPGTVEAIGAGSGAAFSLLPAQNATGNWVKVTQRFPVRIAVEPPADPAFRLRVGASVTATVDTTGADAQR